VTSRVLIPPKGLAETRTDLIDFSPFLLVGQAVASVVGTCTVYSGTDASPGAVLSSVTLSGTTGALVKTTGGVLGVIYQVRVDATTGSPAGVLSIVFFLAVVPDLP
jgi:hypothetical protein